MTEIGLSKWRLNASVHKYWIDSSVLPSLPITMAGWSQSNVSKMRCCCSSHHTFKFSAFTPMWVKMSFKYCLASCMGAFKASGITAFWMRSHGNNCASLALGAFSRASKRGARSNLRPRRRLSRRSSLNASWLRRLLLARPWAPERFLRGTSI